MTSAGVDRLLANATSTVAGMEITRLAPFQDARDRMPGTSVLDGCVYPESVRFREFSNT